MSDKFDKFNAAENDLDKSLLDESVLYLSSNWSARMSIKTQHEFRNFLEIFKLPVLDIQKAIDLPESDDEEEV